jgi:MraZ protein
MMSSEFSQVLAGAGGAQAPFMGKHVHKLDPKKRLTIPSAWRQLMGNEGLYLMPGLDGRRCLMLMPSRVMTDMLTRLQNLKFSNAEHMDLMLEVAMESDHLSFDAQGRIRVKDDHLALAELAGDVVMAGAINRIELWNPDQLKARASSGITEAAKALDM